MPESGGYLGRAAFFERSDPSHLIASKNPWGEHDDYSFIVPVAYQGLHFRCPACNNLHDSDFLDVMVCSRCGWKIPSKAVARDIFIESQNVSVNFGGGWTREALELFSKAPMPCTGTNSSNLRPVGETARNLSAWHIQSLEADIIRARQKSAIIADLRSSSPNASLMNQWRM